MTELGWQIVALVLIGLANFRLGQYLSPPLKDEFERLTNETRDICSGLRAEMVLMNEKINALMVDKGFRND